ncbi:hypothetical protein QTN25_002750 [Entamoeba marina]
MASEISSDKPKSILEATSKKDRGSSTTKIRPRPRVIDKDDLESEFERKESTTERSKNNEKERNDDIFVTPFKKELMVLTCLNGDTEKLVVDWFEQEFTAKDFWMCYTCTNPSAVVVVAPTKEEGDEQVTALQKMFGEIKTCVVVVNGDNSTGLTLSIEEKQIVDKDDAIKQFINQWNI